MPRVTRKSVASKEESSSTESQGSAGQRKRGAKKDEPASGDVEKQQATTSKRGGRQAAKEVQKSDASVKKKAASRRTSRGGREKKNKESESEDSDEDGESDQEEQSVSKGRGKGKSSSTAKNTNKVEQGSKAAKTGNVRARGKAGRSSRETRKHEDNDEEEEEEEDEESDEGTAVKGKSTGTRGGARQSGKTTKTEESQDETEEARPQGKTGKNRKVTKSDDKSVDAGENEEEESEEETHSAGKGKGQKGKGKAVKLEEKVEEEVDDKAEDKVKSKNIKSRGKGKASTVSKSGRQTTENEASVGESEEMEVVDEAASESKRASLEEMETESTKSSRGQKGDSTEKSLSKARTKAGVASTSAASGNQAEKLETEHMETVDEIAATKTVKESEKVPAESSFASKHKLEDDKTHTAKKLRLSEESESADKTEHYSDDVEGSDSQEVADLQQSAVTERSQPTTPEDTSYDGPRINPFVATPGVPFVVPLTEAELAKQYTTQLMDRDETSSILVEVGSECASDVTGVSTRGLEVGDIVSLDSMDLSQVEAPADSSTDLISRSSSARDATFQEPCSVSAGDKLVASRNSTPVTASTNPQAAAASSQLPASAQSNQLPGILEVHAGSASGDSASREESSHTSSAPNQNGTVEVATGLRSGPENSVPETYVPSSTAIDCRKFILNPSFPADSMDPAFCFSVISYNILADCHMRRGDYSYTQPQFLEQKYRHKLLLKELDYLDGDVVCLQEVNPAYYTQLLQPDMKSRGYDGYFIKRTKEYWDEGAATFVKTSKFDVKSHQSMSLAELAFREVDDSGLNEDISRAAKKYLDRADVILLTELTCKKTGKAVNVCNIHVVYDPKAIDDVQCIQLACAIKQLVAKAGSDLHPHIICGDFNSEVTSPAYQLAKDGYLSDDHIQKLQSLQNLDIADGSPRSLIHHMWRAFQHTSSNLKSAYELTLGKEPPVTSFTNVSYGTLDYIFYSAVSLDVAGVLETLDLPVVNATGGLPSDNIPSDHLSLKTVFRLK